MCSGGSQKLDFAFLYVEAPIEQAKAVFYNRFGRNPDRVTCTCCGADYSIDDDNESLEEASQFDRRINWRDDDVWPLDKFTSLRTTPDGQPVSFIYASEIAAGELTANIPEEGYVWR
jgi:hypothetical protein